ncbi:unnamed protein product [Rotaria sp. Silwood2]|nr:unnamed protein product [Rotaria sp. Silwood2]
MANSTRRRLSFVDFPDPQVWHKLIEYAEVTIAFTKLITDFTNQSAKIWFLASSQLHQLVSDFRRKTEIEIRERCHLGGMMYDLWESLLLESELESQSLKKMACLMEKEICTPLASFITNKSVELSINKQHRSDLHEILETSHNIVQELQKEYAKIYSDSGVTPEFHRAHNQYVIELVGVNGLLSKYQYHVLPQLLQGMEQSQIGVIDTVCQNLQLIASLIQNYHEQRHRSFASFVVTSSTTDPNEELENYICSINESSGEPSTPPINIEFEIFHSPFNKLTTYNSRLQHLSPHNSEQLIVYAAPIIQSQLSAHCREAAERLKEVKKEKSALLAVVNKAPTKHHLQHEDQQQDWILLFPPCIEYKFVSIIAQNSGQLVKFQPLLNNIAILYRNGGGDQVKGILFTGKNATGISGSRNDQEKPPGMIENSNCTFTDIGDGVINRFIHISIVGVAVSQAQWLFIELRDLVQDLATTVQDIFILNSGNGLIICETDGAFTFWNIVCRNNKNGGLIIYDMLSGPLTITESTFDNNRIANVFISNSYAVIVRDSLIINARPKSDDSYGDGFVAMKNKEPIELRTSAVYDNYRSGVSVWGGRLIVINNHLHDHKFDLNYETFDGIPGDFEGSAGNICSDSSPDYICSALSSVLEPPRPISPTH